MADDDDAGVNAIVQQAVARIRGVGDDAGQTLQLRIHPAVSIMDDINAQFIATALVAPAEGTAAVKELDLSFLEFSQEAADTFRELFATTSTLRKIKLNGPIGNENGVLLLSGLHHNRSVTWLELVRVGFEGAVGGAILCTLLRIKNSSLKTLLCHGLPLGVPGARALQPALRFNQTVKKLQLRNCGLGDEGLSVVVNALDENATITSLFLAQNHITSNGLPHVNRLLQRDSLAVIDIGLNRGLFDNEENTRIFSSALAETTLLRSLGLCHCFPPVHAIVTIFGTIARSTTITCFVAFERVQMQGQSLEYLRDLVPEMQNLQRIVVNLDYMDASTLSCFHRNTSIQYLNYLGPPPTGPIFIILERNRRLHLAIKLLAREKRQRRMVSLGVWGRGVGRLARDNTGATATYKILQEKLVHWWAPTGPTAATAPAPTSTTAVSNSMKTLEQQQQPHKKQRTL